MSNRLSCATCHAIYNKTFFPKQEEAVCKKCIEPLVFRASDQGKLAKKRIDEFFETTDQMVQKELKTAYRIDGNQPIDQVKKQVDSLVEKLPKI
jgi:adenylate kinase